MKPRWECSECGCDTAVRVWTAQDFGEYLVACVKCGKMLVELEKEKRRKYS